MLLDRKNITDHNVNACNLLEIKQFSQQETASSQRYNDLSISIYYFISDFIILEFWCATRTFILLFLNYTFLWEPKETKLCFHSDLIG